MGMHPGPYAPQASVLQPPTPRQWFKKKRFVIPGALVALVIMGQAINGGGSTPATGETVVVTSTVTQTASSSASSVSAPTSAAKVATTKPAAEKAPATTKKPATALPAGEQAFISEIEAAKQRYADAATDLQRSQAMRTRNKNLVKTLGGREVTRWSGTIKRVGANGEGKAYVDIEIADDVVMGTWNNAFSDASDGTLIPTSSPFFEDLVALAPGDKVTFSGTLFRDDDATLRTMNITEAGSVLRPEFLMDFNSIKRA